MAAMKILVVGAIQGQFEKAFQKISKLHAKQNFSFAIVVGDLFAAKVTDESEANLKSLLDGTFNVPLPTYFTVGDSAIPATVQGSIETKGEVCPNLFYLGRKGVLKTTEGVRIVNVGGRLVQNQASLTQALSNHDPLFLDTDASALRGANQAEILVTNQWPARINLNSNTPLPENVDIEATSESLARLCTALKPRYYFSSSPTATSKWEREPFLHPKSYEDSERSTDATRFVSLASVNGSAKDWMYAFTLDLSEPPNTSGAQLMSPLTFSPKRKRPAGDENDPSTYSRFDTSAEHHNKHRHHNNRHQGKRARYDPDDCFMCMGRPGFNAGMVISISDESFLTVLKGPLPEASTFPQLKSAGHTMIIPMHHAASETSNSKRSISELEAEFADMTRYRHSLNSMMAASNLGAVTWGVNRTGIRHFHLQHIAAPSTLVVNGLVEAAYKVAAEKAQYPAFQSCEPDKLIPDHRADFFRVWIFKPSLSNSTKSSVPPPANPIEAADAVASGYDDPNDKPEAASDDKSDGQDNNASAVTTTTTTAAGVETSMWFPIDSSSKFNISFGREVMAGLLQLEPRSDWRGIPPGGEAEDAEAMKVDFESWDFAMQ